jgi:hypothetical protein
MRFRNAARLLGLCLLVSLAWSDGALAQKLTPLAHPIGVPGRPQASALVHPNSAAAATATNPWTPLTNQPTFLVDGASNPILLTDGSVLVQDQGFPDWWKLTPDQNGSYANGTWTEVASLPAPYSPLYHSSGVLPDGRLIIEGGEYLCDPATFTCNAVWTNMGAIYDPLADTWTLVTPPAGWTTIGDAQSVVLANGTFMQANCCTNQAALLNPQTLTWTATGANKFDPNDEEGWTLLPNRKVLTVDAYVPIPPFPYIPNGTNSELYNPRTGAWSSAGSTKVQLWDSAAACGALKVATFELGPGVLRPDGTVFYMGSNSCAAGHTAIYDSNSGHWRAGPDFPGGLDIADGPAALEPNGKVLMMASPGAFNTPSTFLEWDGHDLTTVPGTPNAATDSSFFGNMLVLPTGQILLTDFSDDIEIYTPQPASRGKQEQIEPLVFYAPSRVRGGGSYLIFGVGFNGVSQGAAYGDDVQAATNFPVVRITNLRSGHVFYSRTHDHSSMAVASPELVWTTFDVPSAQERGASKLEVVANGVASDPVFIEVR